MEEIVIYKAFEPVKKLPLNYNGDLKLLFDDYLSKVETQDSVRMFRLKNSFISKYGLVFMNGRLHKDTIYEYDAGANSLIFNHAIIKNRVKVVLEPCVVFHYSWFDNYYHWCAECLPRLFAMRDHIKDRYLILPEVLKKFHIQYLSFFDFKGIITCGETEIIKAENLIFCSFTAKGWGIHHHEIISEMANYLLLKAKKSTRIFSKNIYTSRRKCQRRKCVNEPELISLLQNFGFETVVMDDLDVYEQMHLFSSVHNVISIHGASFANCMYMQPGGKIFDLIEINHNDLCLMNLAHIFNVDYVYITCKGEGPPNNFRNNDLVVDIEKLHDTLSKYLPA